MLIKKLMFCVLCFANAVNLATEEDFNNENFSNSEVEENVLINKNSLNTRKWGNLYFLFPHLSYLNIKYKNFSVAKEREEEPYNSFSLSLFGLVKLKSLRILNFILSGVMEYKYMFHKYCGINIRFNLNNHEFLFINIIFISLDFSLEWIYGRKGKHLFSGSFSPVGVNFVQNNNGTLSSDFCKNIWSFGFMLFKYEYNSLFYFNFGKIKLMWKDLIINFQKFPCYFFSDIKNSFLSIEFGLNIIGANDWRKKKKKNASSEF